MAIYDLNSKGRIFHSREHGTRILFTDGPTNPRDELGKNGVNIHNWFTGLFRRVVKVRLLVSENGIESERTVRLNRNSLLQYVSNFSDGSASSLLVTMKMNDTDLVMRLNDLLNDKSASDQFFEAGTHLRHAGTHNQRPILTWRNQVSDYVGAKFFSWLYKTTLNSLNRLRMRFLFVNKEQQYFAVSEKLAKQRFMETRESVPAYKKHFERVIPPSTEKSKKLFGDIPFTSKSNYITPNAESDEDLHFHGVYPKRQKIDTSTGTTGKPTTWVRGEEEVDTVKKTLKLAIEIEAGKDRRLHYINAFALGPWATGMTSYELMRATGDVFAAGTDNKKIIDELERVYTYEQNLINKAVDIYLNEHGYSTKSDIYKTFYVHQKKLMIEFVNDILNAWLDNKDLNLKQTIQEFHAQEKYKGIDSRLVNASTLRTMIKELNQEKSQIVIAGYPPYLKELIDKANADGKNFKKYHARAIVGGQAISEALREQLIHAGLVRVNSSYGASDCDINIGVETEFEISLRKTLEKHPEIARELYGEHHSVPMIFHYDPFNYHIESTKAIEADDDNKLIFTCNRDDRSSPRIRYDLGDKGRVFAVSDVQAILAKHGKNIVPKINLPLVFVWGRDSDVAYRGAKVAFTDLERAITNIDTANNYVKRAFYKYEDTDGQEQFEIWTELKEGVPLPTPEESQDFLRKLLVEIGRQNQDFRSHLDAPNAARLPALRIYTKGKSPIADADGPRKQVLVYKDSNLSAEDIAPRAANELLQIAVEKDAIFKAEMAAASSTERRAPNANYGASSSRLMPLPSDMPVTAPVDAPLVPTLLSATA